MSPPKRRPGEGERRLDAVFDAFLADQGFPDVRPFSAIQACWADVVGADVAAHVRPLALRGAVLVVAVDQPGWATQVAFLATQILEGLSHRLENAAPERLEATMRALKDVE
ncbi:MAG: hypothetical protein JWM85_3152 [Acidimicrobiaceae bacterium]|nr:hypothetical protein [Acidimicrobiaceae bacterium]